MPTANIAAQFSLTASAEFPIAKGTFIEDLVGWPPHKLGRCIFRTAFGTSHVKSSHENLQDFTLWLIGDSTMRNMFLALCLVLDRVSYNGSAHYGWKPASCRGQLGEIVVHAAYIKSLVFHSHSGDTRQFMGYLAPLPAPNATIVSHVLWLMRPVPFWPSHEWPTYSEWRYLEKILPLALTEYTKESSSKHVLIIAKAPAVCSHTHNRLRNASRVAGHSFAGCTRWLIAWHHVDEHEAHASCESGARSYAAASLLNGRLVKIVQQWRSANQGQVSLVDFFSLTKGHCNANLEGDDKHFVGLIYAQLALLFKQLPWHQRGRVKDASMKCRNRVDELAVPKTAKVARRELSAPELHEVKRCMMLARPFEDLRCKAWY